MTDSKDDKLEDEKVYGGCEGPEAMYVKLVSSDGHEFIVKREHALTSGTIKAMLSGPGVLPNILCIYSGGWADRSYDEVLYKLTDLNKLTDTAEEVIS